jgi:drug/metabolite transporter (DMT)-like permease
VTAGTTIAAARPSRAGPRRRWLYGLVGLMQLIWAINYLVGKVALREVPAPLAGGVRIVLAALGMLPLYWWRGRDREPWQPGELRRLVLLGAAGVAVNQTAFVLGLARTSVAHSAILMGTTPVWVLLLAGLRGLERFTPGRIVGLAAAFGGLTILSLERQSAGGGPTLAGDLLTLLAAASFAGYVVIAKETAHGRYNPIAVNLVVFVSAAVALLPLVIWQAWSFPLAQVSLKAWLAVAYMGLCSSMACYLIFYYVLHHLAASRLAMFSYLQPVGATVLGALLLHEHVTAPLILAGAVILAGVYITQRSR